MDKIVPIWTVWVVFEPFLASFYIFIIFIEVVNWPSKDFFGLNKTF